MPSLAWFADAPAGGDDPLARRRRDAVQRFETVDLPTAEEEIWRYSRVDQVRLDDYAPVAEPGSMPVDGHLDVAGVAVDRIATVTVVDGHVTAVDVAADAAEAGLVVVHGVEAADHLGSAMAEPVDAFALLNDAAAADPVAVVAPAGFDLGDRPVVVRSHVASEGTAVLARLVVVAGPGARLTTVEEHASADVAALSLPVTELRVEAGARLHHVVVQDLAPTVWQIGSQVAVIGEDAALTSAGVALGGGYARLRVETRMAEPGARGDIMAVYLGDGDQTLDFRTVQDHTAPRTASDLLFKGAVDDRSQSIYTGNIRIAKDAAGVEAFQTNRTVKLSGEAWAESVPNLEIENNDVRCSHASAIGPIDEEHRFYLESRGVPPDTAERLVVLGFLGEALDRLPLPGLAAHLALVLAGRVQATDPEVAR